MLFSLYSIISHIGFAWPDFSVLRPYLAFGLPLLPIGLFDTLINSSDRYVIGFFKGATSVGIYSATYSIGLLAIVSIFPIAYILSPTIFKLFDEGNIDKVKIRSAFDCFATFRIEYVSKPIAQIVKGEHSHEQNDAWKNYQMRVASHRTKAFVSQSTPA